ncbi:biopolymer transport protein ExbB/TolQ [Sporomusaceae bacterium BoRhaA]|uniref:hypothetical protein n=1 Tax=Pelorhabdus rhamnosifermentans TaxID=2772457 RepID=UPI001C062445|nr:hypothetical protein [Pelorhabdus rhamnosifermentans]MBU2702249.1 biopolymer transport protein ExbB/TolQ [Pelorhabdus rhamnosifermentans]
MRKVVKKIIIYSMVGMMQIGLGATVLEASPWHNDDSQRIVQLDDRQQQENERHEWEMRRHHHESVREWHERQCRENERHERYIRQENERLERENQRHDNTINEIAAGVIGYLIGSANK